MNQPETPWTFGDLRAFFHDEHAHTTERFHQLIEAMRQAWETQPQEVEQQWIPYATKLLDSWPFHVRESLFDATDHYGEHPLYRLVATDRFEYLGSSQDQTQIEGMLRYAHTARLEGLVSFELDSLNNLSQAQLADILAGLSQAPLQHFGLTFLGLNDDWVPTLKAAPLAHLTSLDLGGHRLSAQGMVDLANAPYLQQLRHMSFSDVADQHTPEVQTQIKLMDALPELITTQTPHNARPWYEVKPTWRDEAQPTQKSTQARVEAALQIYRQEDDDEYPFLGSSFGCFGDFIELSDETFDDPDVTLEDVFEDYEDIALDSDMDITTIYVLAIRQGALDGAFDASGELITTIEFRAFGHSWRGGPNEEGTYNGEYFAQTWFAKWQLFLAFGANNTLRLLPTPPATTPDLLRFMHAVDAASTWVGGWHLDYYCSPWLDPLNGTEFGVDMRCMIAWEERDHAFDQHGQLKEHGQKMLIWGDAVPLLRVLKDVGFHCAIGYGNSILLQKS